MDLIKRVKETIDDLGMLRGGEKVGVAVSGGVDSVVLLDLLGQLSGELKLSLVVLHLEHGIRGEESRRDEAFVQRLAQERGLLFHSERVDTPSFAREEKLSLEEAARELRYRFFEAAHRQLGLERIALGHTADDQVETVLMAFLRGGGLRGLKGIPPVRGPYIRPLLRLWREEIEAYARRRGLRWVMDSSNLETAFLRNRVRQELIPFLEAFNPRIKGRLLEMAEVLREEDEALEAVAAEALEGMVHRERKRLRLSLEELLRLPRGVRSRLLGRLVSEISRRPLSYRHHQALGEVMEGKARAAELPSGIRASREGPFLFVGPEEAPPEVEERLLEVPGVTRLEELDVEIEAEVYHGEPPQGPSPEVALLEYDKLKFPLRVRGMKEGNRFVPSGMMGTKKLQDFFTDEKVPRSRRRSIPLVLSGEEICWVVGFRVDERFRAKGGSRKVLLLRAKRARL